jgi:hypothetical protein
VSCSVDKWILADEKGLHGLWALEDVDTGCWAICWVHVHDWRGICYRSTFHHSLPSLSFSHLEDQADGQPWHLLVTIGIFYPAYGSEFNHQTFSTNEELIFSNLPTMYYSPIRMVLRPSWACLGRFICWNRSRRSHLSTSRFGNAGQIRIQSDHGHPRTCFPRFGRNFLVAD